MQSKYIGTSDLILSEVTSVPPIMAPMQAIEAETNLNTILNSVSYGSFLRFLHWLIAGMVIKYFVHLISKT
jgi:quinol-cytochrome oxidoreductase complex cytochrome b subunit